MEEDVEKSLQREESRLDVEEQSYPDNVQKVVQELKSKHNVSTHFVTFVLLLMRGKLSARDRAITETHERDGHEACKGGARCGSPGFL